MKFKKRIFSSFFTCETYNVTFYIYLLGIAKHFRFGNQEDAHEFLRYTIDAMQKACLNGSNK